MLKVTGMNTNIKYRAKLLIISKITVMVVKNNIKYKAYLLNDIILSMATRSIFNI